MVDTNFKKAVSDNKLNDVRNFLRVRLTLDHNYVSGMFIECRDYCFSYGITESALYQSFDGRPLPMENTEENFKLVLGQLSTNFAKERIERLIEIGKKLWPNEQIRSGVGKVSKNQKEDISGADRRVIKKRLISTSRSEEYDGFNEKKNAHSNNSSKLNNTIVGVVVAVVTIIIIIIIILNSNKQ